MKSFEKIIEFKNNKKRALTVNVGAFFAFILSLFPIQENHNALTFFVKNVLIYKGKIAENRRNKRVSICRFSSVGRATHS